MADDYVKQEIPLSEEEWEEINRNNAAMPELFDEQAQRDDYNTARDKIVRAEGFKEGFKEGYEEVLAELKLETARKMLSLGTISLEDIAKITGFTLEKIKELAMQSKNFTA